MSLYDEIATVYDEIFPLESERVAFALAASAVGAAVLDVGCATGALGLALAQAGRRVTGVDLDPAMVAMANAAARHRGVAMDAEFRVLDMRRLERELPRGGFDAAFCLGNTLPHLAGPAEMAEFLASVRRLLVPGGRLALQVLNYQRILEQDIRELPPLVSGGLEFLRSYRPKDAARPAEGLWFDTELRRPDPGTRSQASTLLYPIQPARLLDILADCGFGQSQAAGSWQGGAFNSGGSFMLVVSAVAG